MFRFNKNWNLQNSGKSFTINENSILKNIVFKSSINYLSFKYDFIFFEFGLSEKLEPKNI